ncbi:MAG: penicillin-binding protein 2, partial [Bacteroidaceae bacterium]|nr:penicillin-binding protein 2 [Bacteroidaceae bacterium]
MALTVVVVYLLRLLSLQIMSDDYKKNADNNAFLKRVQFPSRGVIYDRNDSLLVYNEPAYDIMVVMDEQMGVDTMAFCKTIGITKEEYIARMLEVKDRNRNPGYSRYTQQLFMSQIPAVEASVFHEKLAFFNGFYIQNRSTRQYSCNSAAHILGDVGEVSPADIEEDEYYESGDYIGKLGVEKSYEALLRGEKGVEVLLRDARGRIKGHYQHGKFDKKPVPGHDLTLGIDIKLQRLGERLMQGKIGSVVALDPTTGEVLCMVSSPSYDPRLMVGHKRGKNHLALSRDPRKPLLNRAIMGQYPPGSTFKTSQALTFLQEGIITPGTAYPCHHGFQFKGLHVGCHGHASPLPLAPAISTSCNGYFCWGL